MLAVVCGLPGVGKTTVARAVADRIGADVLRTDVVRKELVEEPRYTAAETRRVYDELLRRAGRRLETGAPAALDGTFGTRAYRVHARAVAADAGVPFRLMKVECDPATVRDRMAARTGDASDADFAIHLLHRRAFDSLRTEHATVDNSGPPGATRRQAERLIERDRRRDRPG